jgi:CheY-like chemotaxis protein
MLRATPESLLGRNGLDFVPSEGRAASDAGLARRRAGVAEQVEVKLRRADGTVFDARAAATILERAGYRVLVSTSPTNALDQARAFEGPIALLLTDVVMPEMSGKVLAQAVAKLRPDTRVLYMSGYTENTIVHHGVLDEGIAFLPKPITPDALLSKVRQLLDRPDGL